MKKGLFIILLYFFVSNAVSASDKEYPATYPATMARVINSVTYLLDVDIGGQTQRITLSLAGVESPKMYLSSCEVERARFAKKFVQALLWPDETLLVSDVHRSKQGLQGDIHFAGRDLAGVLVGFNQARPNDVDGSWCNS